MIPEDLELLADLRADIAIPRVHCREPVIKRVQIRQREIVLVKFADACQHVGHPSSRLCILVPQECESLPNCSDQIAWNSPPGANGLDPGIKRKSIEEEITSHPTFTASFWIQGPTLFENRTGKKVARDEEDVSNTPLMGLVAQENEIRSRRMFDSVRHRLIRCVSHLCPERTPLALELKTLVANAATEVHDLRTCRSRSKNVAGASRTVELIPYPLLGQDSSYLRLTRVFRRAGVVEPQVHRPPEARRSFDPTASRHSSF
jgi:hypothetical protein